MHNTDDNVRSRIIDETDGLAIALNKNHFFEASCLIREWSYRKANIAPTMVQDMFRMYPVEALSPDDAATAISLYDDFSTGSVCGGTAHFLSQVYRMFGFEATTYNFGIPEHYLTHVITLVKIKKNNIIAAQDAYLNGFFTYDETPLDFRNLANATDMNRWGFEQGRARHKTYLFPPLDKANKKIKPCTTPAKKTIKFTWTEGQKWFNDICIKNNLGFFSFFELMYYPINYVPISQNEESILRYLDQLSIEKQTSYHAWAKSVTPCSHALMSNYLQNLQTFVSEGLKQKELSLSDKVVVYGAQGYGAFLAKALNMSGFTLTGIVDGNEQFWGKSIGKLPAISPPDTLATLKPDVIFICSLRHEEEMLVTVRKLTRSTKLITLSSIIYHENQTAV